MSVLVQRLGLSSTGNRATWTFSAWVKRNRQLGGSEFIFSSNTERTGGGQYSSIYFGDDQLRYYDYYNSSSQKYLITNRRFKDISGWYHIVVRVDTTQSTASDRIRFYVNGVQETSFDSSDYPAVNDNSSFVNWASADNFVGTQTNNLSGHFLGTLSHVHLADGQSYGPDTFGSTDATTGEWKINTSPTVTYGTNGFFLFKNDNVVTDRSGQGNNFSIGSGTLTLSKDCPSNVFATLDPLNVPASNAPTFSNGNTKVVTSTGGNFGGSSTLGASSGKYYFEIKFTAESSSNMGNISLSSSSNARESARTNQHSNQLSAAYPNLLYEYDGNVYKDSGSSQGNFGAYAVGDIIMIAMDLDNQKAYFGKNGTWGNSGVPTSGSTGTGSATLSANSGFWHLALGDRNSSATATYEVNFGNGYFGTTAVSSAGSNASNIGIFEYDVPAGYTALSTKGLNL